MQSITNMIIALQHNYQFYVITTAFDLMCKDKYDSVEIDCWNQVQLPGAMELINVWYSGKKGGQLSTIKQLMNDITPQVIYLNGIYSLKFFLFPLFILRKGFTGKLVICPRGMLQSGALSVKSNKKKLYIKLLQISGLFKNVIWHATNGEESDDILYFFPNNKGIHIAFNVPKTPYKKVNYPDKKAGELNMVYLSLITEKKNLLLLLHILRDLSPTIRLHIYGPVKDQSYWEECKNLINKLSDRVMYHGDVQPAYVQQTIEQYHVLTILTKGENFGHALYECLSVGRPLITSNYTPWNKLKEMNAGVNVTIEDTIDCIQKITELAAMSQEEYNMMCDASLMLAKNYFTNLNTVNTYKKLFG